MLVQYSKFSKMAGETSFRKPIASLTYIETSTWTRQGTFLSSCEEDEADGGTEHNGFSHQNPGFIQTVLSLPTHLARVYFPFVPSLLALTISRSSGSSQRRRQHCDLGHRSLPQVEELCQPHRRHQGSFAQLPEHRGG